MRGSYGEWLRHNIIALYGRVSNPYIPRLVILSALVGVVGGLAAVGFNYLILVFKNLFFGAASTVTFLETVRSLPWQHRLLAPALGGLIIGPLVTFVAREARGGGVPEVMEAVALRGGAMRLRVLPLKAFVSAICIGSGGAAGREGPIVQIGATFGSALGGFLKLTPDKVETLVGAGAAAGIAGTFNAPLAGVVFSMEVLLKPVKLSTFSPIVVAAVIGTAVANSLFGRTGPVFDIPVHQMVTYWELLFYVGLGVVSAFIALLYTNTLYRIEQIFETFPLPTVFKPALGGLMLGVLALAIPQIYATGYPVMESALHSMLPMRVVFMLMLAKILATGLTLGSGGSGGIFAPALFIGAMMGSTYGMLVNSAFPGITAAASSYAMVGMGAVFAGATHAPLSVIVILFEMTRDPQILLPIMFTCIVSSVLASRIQRKSIYTAKLLNRGVDIEAAESQKALANLTVKEAMNTHFATLRQSTPVAEAVEIFRTTLSEILPVVDENTGALRGLAEYRAIIHYLIRERDESVPVGEIVNAYSRSVREDDTLAAALQLLENADLPVIPVLGRDGSDRIVGMLSTGVFERGKPPNWLLYLSAKRILLDLPTNERDRAIAEICTLAAASTAGFSPEDLTEAVLTREREMSTALDREVAFPHARLAGLKYPVVIIARSTDGIEWNARDRRPVRLVFLTLTPEEDPGVQVTIARGIMAAVRDARLRGDLLRCESAAVLLARLVDAVEYERLPDRG